MEVQEVTYVYLGGIYLAAPENVAARFPKQYTYETFPINYCGAGNGFQEKIIPDYVFGFSRYAGFLGLDCSIKISPACKIHDDDYDLALPYWDDFRACNDRLQHNIEQIIEAKSRNEFLKAISLYRPVTYRNAVDIFGKSVFWSLKEEQGFDLPINAQRYVSEEIKLIHRERIKEKK